MSTTCNCYHVPSVWSDSKPLKPTLTLGGEIKIPMNSERFRVPWQAFLDDDGSTYICEACPAGQQQLSAGAMACDACPAGTAKAEQSTEECAPCVAGGYCSKHRYFNEIVRTVTGDHSLVLATMNYIV